MPNTTDRPDPPARTAAEPSPPAGLETTERYETDDGVVFYDAANPLAWLEAGDALRLADQV